MAFDDILKHVGEFGRYQQKIYWLLCLTAISCALHKLANVFLQAQPKFRCHLPIDDDNGSYYLTEDIINMTIPWDSNVQKWSSCRMLDVNLTQEYFDEGIPANESVKCEHWIFDTSTYKSSTVMEFELVCDNSWMPATGDALFMVGVLLGSMLFGHWSDRYGRRIIFFISLILQVISGCVAALLPTYSAFIAARMIIGASTSGVYLVAYVIALEMVGPGKRLLAGIACQFFSVAGYLLTAFFAYFIKDWRSLQLAISLPGVLFISYWWFVPESARWLLTKGRHEEAKKIIFKAAKVNKVTLTDDMLDDLLKTEKAAQQSQQQKGQQPSFFDLMRNSNLRKKSLNLFFCWFVNSGTYYGLSWNTSNLGGNDYLNFFIAGAVEIPAYTLLLLTLNRWGRKKILCSSMIIAGVSLLLTLLVPPSIHWLTVTLAMVGKLAISASYGTIYIFSAEQFPTVIRNVALGGSSTCARVGGILAPFINSLSKYWQPLPLLIFGALSLAAGVMSLLLPETMNKKLPDTIEEGEEFGKKPIEIEMIDIELSKSNHTNGNLLTAEKK